MKLLKLFKKLMQRVLQIFLQEKKVLEENIKTLRDQALSSSLKRTNPELYVDKNRKLGDFDIGLIELSHIEGVAQNWRAAFDINNIFLAPGKFNRDQLILDKAIAKQLRKFAKAEKFSEKKIYFKRTKTYRTKTHRQKPHIEIW